MVDPKDWDWMDQKAHLVFEPKALMVKLKEKACLRRACAGLPLRKVAVQRIGCPAIFIYSLFLSPLGFTM